MARKSYIFRNSLLVPDYVLYCNHVQMDMKKKIIHTHTENKEEIARVARAPFTRFRKQENKEFVCSDLHRIYESF